jgi:hypothetical protein
VENPEQVRCVGAPGSQNFQILSREVSLIFINSFLVSEIGSIWSGTTKMKKANKGFERRTVKQLNKINKQLKGLGNQVNEEIQISKKEYESIKE